MITAPVREPTTAELTAWQESRAAIAERVSTLNAAGICYQCEDLRSGGAVLGDQNVIVDHDDVKAVLALDPRVPAHTIVVWKRHVHDFTELDDTETARLFTVCRDVARAIRAAITGVERVYQVTMCDGAVNHLHLQLIPRYAGTPIGSRRLVDARGPLLDGSRLAEGIARSYHGGE